MAKFKPGQVVKYIGDNAVRSFLPDNKLFFIYRIEYGIEGSENMYKTYEVGSDGNTLPSNFSFREGSLLLAEKEYTDRIDASK